MPYTAWSFSAKTVTWPSGWKQRIRSASALLGSCISTGSSPTKMRPSGAATTTEGCWIFGARASTSTFQPGGALGRSVSAARSRGVDRQIAAHATAVRKRIDQFIRVKVLKLVTRFVRLKIDEAFLRRRCLFYYFEVGELLDQGLPAVPGHRAELGRRRAFAGNQGALGGGAVGEGAGVHRLVQRLHQRIRGAGVGGVRQPA